MKEPVYTLYVHPTGGCPKCRMLEGLMVNHGLKATIVDTFEELEKANIPFVPVLMVDDKKLDFQQSLDYLKEKDGIIKW